ncbi:MAG: hypothetical protein O7C75_07035 [Verrucomicrobia bacterium]|nr:hypothetical protein [Verrucomicrobiota bacterium]
MRVNQFSMLSILLLWLIGFNDARAQSSETVTIQTGELSALFRDNSQSPQLLSGVQSLFNVNRAPGYDAFDPDDPGGSAGLNFEHIISGHNNPENKFSPRHGKYSLSQDMEKKTILLERKREDSPWSVSSKMKYTMKPPYFIDFEFECVPHDCDPFGQRGYAVFFWADYMNEVEDVSLHFLGIDRAGGMEKWIAADAPKTHPDYRGGGTYRSAAAQPLHYDDDHNFKLNLWSYDYPRITKPFYVGRATQGMAFILMFDRLYSAEDEIRFSLFKFKVRDGRQRPAWDFQYVIHQVEPGQQYGYKGRLVWKEFVSYEDCIHEYKTWKSGSNNNK